MRHHVFLIPGFFGFANLGDLKYFGHVADVLHVAFARAGVDVQVHHVPTLPTSSVRKRTQRLLQTMAARADGNGPIHLVGHSSGGLDARLLVAAGASLTDTHDHDALVARVRSVATVVTPHAGTPVVGVFLTAVGPRLLQLLSLATIYILRYGKLPLGALVPMVGLLVRLDDATGADALNQLYDELLSDFGADRQHAIRTFFAEVSADQQLIGQLLPDHMKTFNGLARDQPDVRYGCVLAKAQRPGVRTTLSAGLSGYAQSSHALYAALWNLASRLPFDQAPLPSFSQIQAMRRAWGEVPELKDSDGLVPVLSQLHGEVIAAVTADHHDVIGHFDDTLHDPPHFDWLTSGSGFRRAQFEQLWSNVAQWLVADGAADVPAAPP